MSEKQPSEEASAGRGGKSPDHLSARPPHARRSRRGGRGSRRPASGKQVERPSAPAPRDADEQPVAQGIAHEDLPADLPPFEETEPVSLAETVEPGFEPDAVPELDFEPEEESPPPPLTAGVPESERASPPPRTHGRQPGVVGAMEQVREIIESLTETLDQMERVLEMLEDAEREKLTDEREIASLRRLLDNVQRSHASGPRASAQGPPRGPPRPSRGGRR